ncbi:VOC family protein [Rhodocytophaga aerolata]|uniref:VOC family protein n=1 Tax=Rhodocytophaga aerolata TaxID=455078 RepID=A0ABT8RG97_9BACT|nr:VOC family protein [Rhodocytophaga aerolata]MDO1451127.1 VOC family protein [Rhodocytophaga aerolata]
MKPRMTVLTLGVDELEKAVDFYKNGLGFPTEGIIGEEFEHGTVAFFTLQNGISLALWPRKSIAHDTTLTQTQPAATDFTIGHNVASKQEVDAVMQQAENAGATIVKAAQTTFYGGYAGYFQDPDQHIWEIVWNPAFDINEGIS